MSIYKVTVDKTASEVRREEFDSRFDRADGINDMTGNFKLTAVGVADRFDSKESRVKQFTDDRLGKTVRNNDDDLFKSPFGNNEWAAEKNLISAAHTVLRMTGRRPSRILCRFADVMREDALELYVSYGMKA